MNFVTPLIIPTPKQARFSGEGFSLAETVVVRCGPSWDAASRILAARLGPRARFERVRGDALTLGKSGATPAPPKKPEGYAVSVSKRGVALSARDDAGKIWAVQTLLQLFDGTAFHGAEIFDWPTLAFRGVHLFHGPQARPFHEKLIERVFSPFKLNGLVIQSDTIGWTCLKKSPEHVGSLADVRAEVAHARAHGIDAFPLVPSHGHMWWLLGQGREEFREDPDSSWALNVTDSKALALLATIQNEAAQVFGSKNHHLGLDEVIDPVTPRGRVPFRSKLPFAELFAANALTWARWGRKKKKTMWIWADMLMHPSEVKPSFGTAPSVADARKLRQLVPRDFVVVDWQYTARPTYPSLDVLRDAGFQKRVIATWFQSDGILAFSKAAVENGAMGGLQTTWCGYESAESVLDGPERRQFAAMVLAAEAFWNSGIAPPWTPAEIFDRAWAVKP